jgi:late competence protein required for DNA uptake (superfamily II DNA/RNA helicase)
MLAEESLETALICPKCLKFFQRPMTLTPCGHTYCEACVDVMKLEHYDRTHCQECPDIPVEHVFRNEQLESLTERFLRRKSLMMSMMSWIKVLRVFVPDRT